MFSYTCNTCTYRELFVEHVADYENDISIKKIIIVSRSCCLENLSQGASIMEHMY